MTDTLACIGLGSILAFTAYIVWSIANWKTMVEERLGSLERKQAAKTDD